ncbi:hypothetical protein BSKO_12457 [Bryopsis sp. KO-2023]|nr:hypothetical protein BSKO_12457 [Bryopsis sp. KO-2023]
MGVSATLVLGLLAVVTLASDAHTCSDVRVYLGSCNMKTFGRKITRQAALDIRSPVVRREGVLEIADQAIDFFEFDSRDFAGECQLANTVACNLLNCGCTQALRSGNSRHGRKLKICFPVFGCQVQVTGASVPIGSGFEETMLGICIGGHCKAFLVALPEIFDARLKVCRPALPETGCVERPPPICVGEVAKCCHPANPVCFCQTCGMAFFQRKTSPSGEVAVHKILTNARKCTCLGA